MKYYYTEEFRKSCSGLGVFVLVCFASMFMLEFIMAIIISAVGISLKDSLSLNLMTSLVSLASMLIPGFFYCKLSHNSLQELVPFKAVKPKILFSLIAIGLCTAFIGDYMTTILNSNFSIFGFRTNASFSFETHTPIENIFYIISVAIIPPLGEEFAFRGILLGKLRKYNDGFAILVSAVLFGMMHGNIVQIPFAFIVGLALGFIVVKTNSLLPTIIIHFINNFIAVVIDILRNSNVISEDALSCIYGIVLFLIFILGIMSVIFLIKNNYFELNKNKYNPLTYIELITNCFTSVGMILILLVLIGETAATTVIF